MRKELEQTTEKTQLHISVRNLVEFIFREGDIDNRFGAGPSAEAMQEGSRIHRKIQGMQGTSYQAELPLRIRLEEELYDMVIEGRADGIYTGETQWPEELLTRDERDLRTENLQLQDQFLRELVWIDEIKGMYRKVDSFTEPIYVHKAQAMCYAYIYARERELPYMGIRMTYVNLDTEAIRYFHEILSFAELQEWFEGLWQEYRKWADFQCRWRRIRQDSIHLLEFPFGYREGQKKLVADVYRSILREKTLFLQAPTGVGKTISTIFPAVKAVGENLAERIFYLTAKTITTTVARDTFTLLEKQGYQAKTIQITAKEKMCFCEEMECNPLACPYAKGHYDRVNDAVYDILTNCNLFSREVIREHARRYIVCPFELSLDISSFCDNIIGDYNYLFDPKVSLKRFFADGVRGDYIFLIDEAHNLVDRSREMYSAVLCKEDFLAVKRVMKTHSKKIEKLLEKCNHILLEYKRECEGYRIHEDIGTLMFPLMRLATEMDEYLRKHPEFSGHQEVIDFYFAIRDFISIYDLVDEKYVIYSQLDEEKHFLLRLFCVDPSANLQKCIDKGRACVFFSATLLPINYYKKLLSARSDDYAIYASSSFAPEQQLIMIGGDVSTRYTRRNEQEFMRIARYIAQSIRCKSGNYMVFFPSYKLMHQVEEAFALIRPDNCRCIMQDNHMSEVQREEFLLEFEQKEDGRQESLLAFCVMGGIFGEGIDLKNDRLIGVIVVGTGLPQISNEREILKNYYEENGENGFDYAFRYPGLNKVLQAAGRVIRTTEDVGTVLLLDERFLGRDYSMMFPREWKDIRLVSVQGMTEEIRKFWQANKNDSGHSGGLSDNRNS